jgi:hypothetical protein
MSFENDIPFGVKASNVSSIASFASTLDDSYILVIANNCNEDVNNGNNYDTVYNDVTNAAVFGVNSEYKQQAYIGVKTNNILNKIATFNEDIIELNQKTQVNGDLLPSSHLTYDIGLSNFAWRNIFSECVEAGFLKGDGSYITNLDLTNYTVEDLKPSENIQFIENNTYNDNLTIDGGLNVKYLMINGVLFANSNDDIQSLFYSNLEFGHNTGNDINLDEVNQGTSNKFIADNTYDNSLKINGTLEVDDIIVNNHISILNKSIYSSQCFDIVNYTDNVSFNIEHNGGGNIFKISNVNENIFTMKNNGFFGNYDDPKYDIDIRGTINAFHFRGEGMYLRNVNLDDKNTSHLVEGLNKYFTEERVYDILWSEKYFASNQFIPYIDDIEETINESLDELRYVINNVNLDNIYQGTSNQFIVNHIYNDSLFINGTLRVKNIEILEDFEDDIDEKYNNGLKYQNSNIIDIGFGKVTSETVSNLVYDILSNYNLERANNVHSNIYSDDVLTSIVEDVTSINIDIIDIVSNINNIEKQIIETNLDNVLQGTSNKCIANDLYDSSLYINGTLTVRNIEIVDIDNFYEVFQTALPETSDYFMNADKVKSIIEEVLLIKDFEGQIDDKYKILSHITRNERTKMNLLITSQSNEIINLKNDISFLTDKLNTAILRIENLESS